MTMEHMGVIVEVWPVAADQTGIWLLSGQDALRSDRIPSDSEPHWEVENLLGYGEKAALLHSTSWRIDGPRIVLTHMAVIATADLVRADWPGAMPIAAELLPTVGNPAPHGAAEVPAPRYVDVLMHGLRHLRFLLDTDAGARGVLTGRWAQHLAAMEPALAGMYLSQETPAALR